MKIEANFFFHLIIVAVTSVGTVFTLNLPWGPYIISRAGRGAPSQQWYKQCCPLGLKSDSGGVGAPPIEYCSEPCCELLEEITIQHEDGSQFTYCQHKIPKMDDILEEDIKHLSRNGVNKLIRLLSDRDRR